MEKSEQLDLLAERPNLDWSKAKRGKYSNLLAQGTNVVILDPTLLDQFPTSGSINAALHAFLSLPTETRTTAMAQSNAKPYPREDAFDPCTGSLEKASSL